MFLIVYSMLISSDKYYVCICRELCMLTIPFTAACTGKLLLATTLRHLLASRTDVRNRYSFRQEYLMFFYNP